MYNILPSFERNLFSLLFNLLCLPNSNQNWLHNYLESGFWGGFSTHEHEKSINSVLKLKYGKFSMFVTHPFLPFWTANSVCVCVWL